MRPSVPAARDRPDGHDGIARTAIARTGVVYAAGESGPLARAPIDDRIGTSVRVIGQDGLTLIVASPADSPAE